MKVDDLADESSLSVIQIFEPQKGAFLGREAKCVRKKVCVPPTNAWCSTTQPILHLELGLFYCYFLIYVSFCGCQK